MTNEPNPDSEGRAFARKLFAPSREQVALEAALGLVNPRATTTIENQ